MKDRTKEKTPVKRLKSACLKGNEGENRGEESKVYREGMIICDDMFPPIIVTDISRNNFGVTLLHIGH